VPEKAGGVKRDIQLSVHRNFIVIGMVVPVIMCYWNGLRFFKSGDNLF
jgi:hypothetical protein